MRRRSVLTAMAAVAVAALGTTALVGCSDEPTYFSIAHAESSFDRPPPTEQQIDDGAAIVRALATRLGPAARTTAGPDVAWSPLGLATALGMVRAGTRGEAAAAIDELFAWEGGDDPSPAVGGVEAAVLAASGTTGTGDGGTATIDLSSASALWGRSGQTWSKPFLDTLWGSYGASMWMADFEQDPALAAADINDWTASRTAEQVTQVLPRGVTDTDDRLVVTSALWFSAPWATPFGEDSMSFTTADGVAIDSQALTLDADLEVRRGAGWAAVTVPYAAGDFALTLVLPNPTGATDTTTMVADLLPLLTDPGEPTPVALTIPPFAVDEPMWDLAGSGWDPLFTPSADFGPMTANPDEWPRQIDVLAGRTVLRMSAAGTNLDEATESGDPPPMSPDAMALTFDRPFAFILHHVETGTPLFVGWVSDLTNG